ncbi:MAG: GntR family transcriptional regulator [Alphaproteobacteria bacterium]|nr:GntR family transcriptional regulator [Alphaproteobacteria bacterium]MCW5741117.1 GntR family transcriptional regulator [Alphaproteobacteria bacterium]
MDGPSALISRQALHEAVAARLRDMIVEGRLTPGERLNERELCEQLGISRTPLREALRVLATEGLVALPPNRGAQVVKLSPEDVRDTFTVMGALEGLSGELACRHVSDADIAALRAMHEEMVGCHARGDLPSYYRINRVIHERINAIAGNPTLTRTYRALNDRLHALRFRSNYIQEKWDRAVEDHGEMLEALAARDGERLRRILVDHLAHKRDAVLEDMT